MAPRPYDAGSQLQVSFRIRAEGRRPRPSSSSAASAGVGRHSPGSRAQRAAPPVGERAIEDRREPLELAIVQGQRLPHALCAARADPLERRVRQRLDREALPRLDRTALLGLPDGRPRMRSMSNSRYRVLVCLAVSAPVRASMVRSRPKPRPRQFERKIQHGPESVRTSSALTGPLHITPRRRASSSASRRASPSEI